MRRTGLSKRKRVTEGTSGNEDASVWHSTPIEEILESDEIIPGSVEFGTPPNKRPVLTNRPTNIPNRGIVSTPCMTPILASSTQSPAIIISAPSGHPLFSSVLQRHGYIIGEYRNNLQFDCMTFRQKIFEWIESDKSAKHRVESEYEKFVSAMEMYFSSKENLRKAVRPTLLQEEETQPPLLHCLAGIANLQPQVVKSLFPVLTDLGFSTIPDDINLAESIIKQLMWLPDITDGTTMLSGFLDIIENAMAPVQKHIIQAIPFILPPKHHEEVAEKLLVVFETMSQLLPSFLDCFSTLDVEEDIGDRIRNAAIDKMCHAHISDLPAFFAFLFRTDNQSALEDAVLSIREHLVIVPTERNAEQEGILIEIIDKLRFFICMTPDLVSLWTKQVKEDIGLGVDLKPIDLIVLLVIVEWFHTNTASLYALLADKQLTMKLFQEICQNTKPILFQLFKTIADVSDAIMREKNTKLFPVVADILTLLFRNLSPLEGQTIIFNLSSLIVNSSVICQDAALKIFTDVAKTEPKKLQMFAANIMGILEHRVKLSNHQIHALMNVLATIAHIPGSEASPFRAEFSILLRKQLSHHQLDMRCCGVMGAMATCRHLAKDENPDEDEIKKLLNLTWSFVERDKDACIIFFDELAESAHWLPKSQCLYYRNSLREKFENTWTAEAESSQVTTAVGRGGIDLTVSFDANKEVEIDRIVIMFEEQPMASSPIVLPAHLRVMTALEMKVENGDLEDLDALLGSPILFPTVSMYYDKDSLSGFDHQKKYHLGEYLVLAINFFREILSAFAAEKGPDLHVKLWMRLNNIVYLQMTLVKHFRQFPSLPKAYTTEKSEGIEFGQFGGEPVAGPSSAITDGEKKAKKKVLKKKRKVKTGKSKKNKKSKKKKLFESEDSDSDNLPDLDVESDSSEDSAGNLSDDEENAEEMKVDNFIDEIQPKFILPYLRKLDVKVFSFLKYPLNMDYVDIDFASLLVNLSTQTTVPLPLLQEVEVLSMGTLAFLLTEIRWQALDHTNPFDILKVDGFLNSILCHLETISAAYDQDGCLPDVKRKKAEACYRLLINSLTVYFEAVTAFEGDKEALISDNIRTIALRTLPGSGDTAENAPMSEMVRHMAQYLTHLADNAIETSTAEDHIKLLKNVHDLLDDKDAIRKAVGIVVKSYLTRNWKLSSSQVTFFLKSWLSMATKPIKVIHSVIEKLIPDDDEAPIPCTAVYQTCSKGNFHTWFTILTSGLSHHVYKYGRKRGDYEDLLELWSDAMGVLKRLVIVAQRNPKKIIMAPMLKHTRIFLEAFTTGGSHMLPELFKKQPEKAHEFCRDLQGPTRRLQYVCEHSKVVKDQLMVRYIPLVKRTLERLVFRIREILSMEGISNAFWIGQLKHKNLDGEMMSSQPFGGLGESNTFSMDTEEGEKGSEEEGGGVESEVNSEEGGNISSDDTEAALFSEAESE